MKTTILVALFLGLAFTVFAEYEDKFWFRVANHIGTQTPAAIRIKSCGLPTVHVNKKNSGRIGFGLDIAPQVNPNAGGMCSGGCADKKRSDWNLQSLREDDDVGDIHALYASDASANFDVFWSASGGSLSGGDKIMTRVSQGDVAYTLDSDASLTLVNEAAGGEYHNVAVPGVSGANVNIRHYPEARFQFNDDNRIVTQNWRLEFDHPIESCTVNAPDNNEIVSEYHNTGITATNFNTWSFKSRVRFNFAPVTEPDGLVTVKVEWNAANARFLKRVRGTDGTDFAPAWLDDISVKVTAVNEAGTVIHVIDDDANGPSAAVTTYVQACTPADMESMAIRAPLASSSAK